MINYFIVTDTKTKYEAVRYVENLKGQPVVIEVKPYVPRRTDAQNRLMWLWLGILADHCGYDRRNKHHMDDFYEDVKGFLRPRRQAVDGITGEVRMVTVNTSLYNVKEMTEFLEDLENRAHEIAGVEVNLPHPPDYNKAMGKKNDRA